MRINDNVRELMMVMSSGCEVMMGYKNIVFFFLYARPLLVYSQVLVLKFPYFFSNDDGDDGKEGICVKATGSSREYVEQGYIYISIGTADTHTNTHTSQSQHQMELGDFSIYENLEDQTHHRHIYIISTYEYSMLELKRAKSCIIGFSLCSELWSVWACEFLCLLIRLMWGGLWEKSYFYFFMNGWCCGMNSRY